jgi:hypothetical protein
MATRDGSGARDTMVTRHATITTNRVVGKNNYRPLTFLTHLKVDHGMANAKDRKELIPHWGGSPCFFPGCISKKLFLGLRKGHSDYQDHLIDDHDVEEDNHFEYS